MTWFDDLCHWLHDYQPLPPGTPPRLVDLYVEQPRPTDRAIRRPRPVAAPFVNPGGPAHEIQEKLKEKLMDDFVARPLPEWVPPVEFDMEHPENYSREQLIEAVNKIRDDWAYVNTILNNRAITQSWCSNWEYNQICYNMKMRVLRLIPRPGRQHEWDHWKVTKEQARPMRSRSLSGTVPF